MLRCYRALKYSTFAGESYANDAASWTKVRVVKSEVLQGTRRELRGHVSLVPT